MDCKHFACGQESSAVDFVVEGTPGVEERCESIQRHWSHVQGLLLPPSKEAAMRQLVQYALPAVDQRAMSMVATQPLHDMSVYGTQRGEYFPRERFPGVVNLNLAHSGKRFSGLDTNL